MGRSRELIYEHREGGGAFHRAIQELAKTVDGSIRALLEEQEEDERKRRS